MLFGAGSCTVSPSSKSNISCKGIKSLGHLKSFSKNTFAFSDPTQAYLSLVGFSNMLSLKTNLRGFSINVFAQLAGPVIMRFLFLPLIWISKSLILIANWKVLFHWGKELPWYTVTTDQNNLQHSQKSNVSTLYRFEMPYWLPVFLWLTPFGKFWWHEFTECFFISFEYKLSNIHLASSSPLLSNSKELSVASDTPFSNELC